MTNSSFHVGLNHKLSHCPIMQHKVPSSWYDLQLAAYDPFSRYATIKNASNFKFLAYFCVGCYILNIAEHDTSYILHRRRASVIPETHVRQLGLTHWRQHTNLFCLKHKKY